MKILICDDHSLFRQGVSMTLREMGEGVDLLEAGNGVEALAIARANPDLDLVLLDLQMPGMDGWSGLARLRSAFPILPVMILAASEEPRDAQRAIDAGAAGFVPKSTRGPDLRAALSCVLSGGVYFPTHLLAEDPKLAIQKAPGIEGRIGDRMDRIASLTPKQLEVLRLLARGLRNTEIGSVLGMSLGTVKTHVGAILVALEVTNRTEAALVMRDYALDPAE